MARSVSGTSSMNASADTGRQEGRGEVRLGLGRLPYGEASSILAHVVLADARQWAGAHTRAEADQEGREAEQSRQDESVKADPRLGAVRGPRGERVSVRSGPSYISADLIFVAMYGRGPREVGSGGLRLSFSPSPLRMTMGHARELPPGVLYYILSLSPDTDLELSAPGMVLCW